MSLDSTVLIDFISRSFYWVFITILILNMTQRKHPKTAGRKRTATLYLAIAALVIYTGAELLRQYSLGDGAMGLLILAVCTAVYLLRAHTFPFTLTCRCTGRRLNWHTILYRDDNCLPEPEPETQDDDDLDTDDSLKDDDGNDDEKEASEERGAP